MKKILVIGILLMLILMVSGNIVNVCCSCQSKTRSIYVDCSIEIGEIKSLQGVNCGPTGVGRGVDVTEQYQDIGIEMIRTHDFYGPTDVHEIFPDWDADPENESSYNFTSSDEKITPIIEGGFQVFYRLGESWEKDPVHNNPPSDPWKWANICRHIVMHYNDGWANGYHYNITYWEIWNEPDLTHFWTGSPEQYYELYKATAVTLKEYDNSLKIGAPAIAWIGNLDYSTKFIEYVIENSLPLDFFSWHLYDTNPRTFYLFSSRVEKTLHGFGLNETENILSEWNTALAGIDPEEYGNAKGGSIHSLCYDFFARCWM
ncbi:MAG TPA: hypothetical protein ENI33_06100 [Thermoplasmatales archaeon]|nr:hypothetical protein [Thermoplasmatales archaeon]